MDENFSGLIMSKDFKVNESDKCIYHKFDNNYA